MKAAVYKRPNELAVIEIPRPAAGAGEVLLRVHDCGICGSDLHAARYGFGMRPDSVMGHEICGEVAEIGAGVSGFTVGERVASLAFRACGACRFCALGQEMHCENIRGHGFGQLPGGFAEFVACGARSLFRLPDHLTSRQGALVEPLSVARHAVRRAGFEPGARCLVMGAGPIGLATTLWLRALGAHAVVVSEPSAPRAELARGLGATAVVDPSCESPADKMRELTGQGLDVVFECVGAKSTLEQATQFAGPLGRVVVTGVCMEADEITPLRCIAKELTVAFSLGYTGGEFRETIDALAAGRIEPLPIVTGVVGVEQVPEMFELLSRPGAQDAKVLVEFPH